MIKGLEWMFWTSQTAILFTIVFTCMFVLLILDRFWPSKPRKGLFPIETTRGDRFFLGVMFIIGIGLLWLNITALPIEWALIPALIVFMLIQIWG